MKTIGTSAPSIRTGNYKPEMKFCYTSAEVKESQGSPSDTKLLKQELLVCMKPLLCFSLGSYNFDQSNSKSRTIVTTSVYLREGGFGVWGRAYGRFPSLL